MAHVDARAMLGRLSGAAPVGLAAFDRELRFLTINSWLARMNGHSIVDHLGRTVHEMIPAVADRIEPVLRDVLERKRPVYGVELSGPHRLTGEMRHTEATYFPIQDYTGEAVAVGCVVVDTTDRILALHRVVLLQEAVREITAAADATIAAQAVVQRTLEAVNAQGAGIAFTSDGDEWLEFVAVAGPLGAAMAEKYARIPIAARAPACDAFRDGRTIWCSTRAQWEREYPDGSDLVADGARASLAAPLVALSGRRLGILGLVFDHEPKLTDEDLDLVTTFTQQAAQALDRLLLYESERIAREQFQLLAALGARLDEMIEPEERVHAFLDVVVPNFADVVSVELLAREDHTAPRRVSRAIDDVDSSALQLTTVPLVARGDVFGVVTFGRRQRDGRDRDLAGELSRRLAIALENALLHTRERRIAETLQRSLLPRRVPEVDGVRLWARYLPGTDLVVGGDFWDVIELPYQRVLLVVGDVAGRGERAAVVMGRLRTVIQSESGREDSPVALLHALNRFLVDHEDEMATGICAVLDLTSGAVRLANAGHPPILRVTAGGVAEYLGGATGPPLGVRPFATYREDQFELKDGDTLVLFTDGLVERRGESIDDRFATLATITAEATTTEPRDDHWCDRVVDTMIGAARDDDVALLGVRFVGRRTPELAIDCPAELANLRAVRERVRTWLSRHDVPTDDVEAMLLAVGEAVANVAMHAYGAAGGRLRVAASLEDGVVTVRVEDDGRWRSPADDQGHGRNIIEQMSHSTSLDARDDGTTVIFSRRIDAPTPA